MIERRRQPVPGDLPLDIAAMVGKVAMVMAPAVTADCAQMTAFLSSVEDGNPLFWDDGVADELAGETIAPPAMLSTFMRPGRWLPDGQTPLRAMELHYQLKERLGLELAIVGDSEVAMFDPVRPGDRVVTEIVLDEIGPEITNRLGTGRKWTLLLRYLRESDDALLGTEDIRFFSYNRAP